MVFTNEAELAKMIEDEYIRFPIEDTFNKVLFEPKVEGILINPLGDNAVIYKEDMKQLFAKNLAEEKALKKNEKYDEVLRSRNDADWGDCESLEKAIKFAVEKHGGAVRKGTSVPYILHPMETMNILEHMCVDSDLMAAGVLHDVLEDTDVSLQELEEKFGKHVAALVFMQSEDKSKCWYARKLKAIDELKGADFSLKLLVMADKVANLRGMYGDYAAHGDVLWSRFNAPKEWVAWYYSEVQDQLWEMQYYENTRATYWEMVDLYKDLFVEYFLDETQSRIYQFSLSGERHVLKKESGIWEEYHGELPETALGVFRKYAERVEDNWRDEVCVVVEGKCV